MNKLLPILLVVVLSGCGGESHTHIPEPDNDLVNKSLMCKTNSKYFKQPYLIKFINNTEATLCSSNFESYSCNRIVEYAYGLDKIDIDSVCPVYQRSGGGGFIHYYTHFTDGSNSCMKECNPKNSDCYDSLKINRIDLSGEYRSFHDCYVNKEKNIECSKRKREYYYRDEDIISDTHDVLQLKCTVVTEDLYDSFEKKISKTIATKNYNIQKEKELDKIRKKQYEDFLDKEENKRIDKIKKERKI